MVKTAAELAVSLHTAPDILDLIGAAYGADALLLLESDLGPEFLNLKTGLLGELFQKLVNYRLQTAVVIPTPEAHGGHFTELACEHAYHPQIRFFSNEAEARAWLATQETR